MFIGVARFVTNTSSKFLWRRGRRGSCVKCFLGDLAVRVVRSVVFVLYLGVSLGLAVLGTRFPYLLQFHPAI